MSSLCSTITIITTAFAGSCRACSWGRATVIITTTTTIITTTIIITDAFDDRGVPINDEKQDLPILFFYAAYSWRAFSFAAR
jgi:hypothetical protein